MELDAFLGSKALGLRIIPSDSYQNLFDSRGVPLFDCPAGTPFAICVNTDKDSGPGLHWVALICLGGIPSHSPGGQAPLSPPSLFYYDPLLPNAVYLIPGGPAPRSPPKYVAAFIQRCIGKGMSFYENLARDQNPISTWCGAYSAQMIILMADAYRTKKKPLAEAFYDAHKKLSDREFVKGVFNAIKRSI